MTYKNWKKLAQAFKDRIRNTWRSKGYDVDIDGVIYKLPYKVARKLRRQENEISFMKRKYGNK